MLADLVYERGTKEQGRLLRDGLSDLAVCYLAVHSSGHDLLQGTHDAVLLAATLYHQRVCPVRVEHDVVGSDQQDPADGTL